MLRVMGENGARDKDWLRARGTTCVLQTQFSSFSYFFTEAKSNDPVLMRITSEALLMRDHNIGHEPDMVYLPPPPRGSFVDHDFLKAQCLRNILQHVNSLAVGVLRCNSL